MDKKTDAYVDTSAFIAFLDRSDTYHPVFRQLFSRPPKLITTALVIAEAHAWFLRRYDRHRALQFLALIEELTPLRLASVGAAEQKCAMELIRTFSDQDLTMADAVGLHIMRSQKIRHCWSTDFHLSLTGVTIVINE